MTPKKKVKKILEMDRWGLIVELDIKPGEYVRHYDGRIMKPTYPWEETVYRETMEDYEFPPELAAKIPDHLRGPNA